MKLGCLGPLDCYQEKQMQWQLELPVDIWIPIFERDFQVSAASFIKIVPRMVLL